MRTISLCVLGCSMLAAGCGGSSTSPTDVVTQSETFSGTLPPLSIRSHPFRVLAAGAVDIGLTKAGPPDGIVIGLGVGTPTTDGACQLVAGVATAAGSVAQLTGSVTSGGNFCVAVFDLNDGTKTGDGTMTGDVDYVITVLHP